MMKYEVGQKFPHEKYLNRGELTVSILNEAFFDVFVSLQGISSEEKRAWRKGDLKVCLFEQYNIPFIAFDFGNGFSIDVNINIHHVVDDEIEAWLNSEGNVIHLFLIDASTGNLEAMRMIGLQDTIAEAIRDICEKQLDMTIQEIDANLVRIMSVVSTAEMIKKAKLKQTFK